MCFDNDDNVDVEYYQMEKKMNLFIYFFPKNDVVVDDDDDEDQDY